MNVTFSRFAHAAMAALMAGSLAACGGGSSGGVDVGGGGGGTQPPCVSTQGGGSGFALGSCLATHTSVFQPIVAGVQVNAASVPGQDGFVLSLSFPAALASMDEAAIGFTAANQPPSDERNIVGVLRGQAYESPLNAQLTPPYVALTDFHRNWTYTANPVTDTPLLQMSHASFGTWEKFPGSTTNDGFLGVWYAPRDLANDYTWPSGAATYLGVAVGVIAPDGSSGAALDQPYGFSAQVSITVDGTGRIAGGQLDSMKIRYRSGGGWAVADILIRPILLSPGVGPSAPASTTTGTLSTVPAGTDMNLTGGDYQANYIAFASPQGAELAGQLRFRTDRGLVGIASFGTVRQP